MDYLKTDRLIAKKRKAHRYTFEELSKLVGVSPQAISLLGNGQRYPALSSQIMLFKVLGLNPIEPFTGLEIFDDDLKAGIAKYMKRIDERVFNPILEKIKTEMNQVRFTGLNKKSCKTSLVYSLAGMTGINSCDCKIHYLDVSFYAFILDSLSFIETCLGFYLIFCLQFT